VNRKHGQLTFHLTQSLSDHGRFGKYLCKIGKEDSEICHHCGEAVDDAHHTLFVYPSWSSEREDVIRVLGALDQSTMVERMIESRTNWDAVAEFSSRVLSHKEEKERYRRGEQPRP